MMTYSNLLLGFLYLTFLLVAQIINGSEVSHEDEGAKLNLHKMKQNSSANDENSELPEGKITMNNETSKDQEMFSTTKILTNTIITSKNLTNNYTKESSHDQTDQTFITHENTVTESVENTDQVEGSGEGNETSDDGGSVDVSSDTGERNEISGDGIYVDGGSDTDDMTLVVATIRHNMITVQEDSSSKIVWILVPISLVFVVLSLIVAAVCIMKYKMYSVLPKYYE